MPVDDSPFADEVEEGVDVVWPDPDIHCSCSWLLSSVSLMIHAFSHFGFVRLLPTAYSGIEIRSNIVIFV